MIALPVLALWPIVALCPLARALALNLVQATSMGIDSQNSSGLDLGVGDNAHCTKDPNWLVPAFPGPDLSRYDFMCQDALVMADRELASHGRDTEFEFLDRGATAQTTKPQIQLPRKYVATPRASESHLPSCTIAIAMIDSLAAGDPLPEQPPGPFGLSDVATMREILFGPLGWPFSRCVRYSPSHTSAPDPMLGWSQAGRVGNIGVFYLGTRSTMDRRIPRALHPTPLTAEE